MDSNLLDMENYEFFDSNKLEEEFDCLREGEPDDDIPSTQYTGHGYILSEDNIDENVDEEYFSPREGDADEVGEEDDIPMSWVNIELDIDNQEGESTH